MKALIILANGFEDIEAAGTIAIVRRAGIELDITTIEEGNTQGKYGISMNGCIPLSGVSFDDYEMVILPGGPGYSRLQNSSLVKDLTLNFNETNKYIAAICAAPTILGSWGLLKNKTYTCFPGMQKEQFGGVYKEDKAVIDGNIITGKAAGAVTDFALAIIKIIKGDEAAKKIKEEIYY